MAQHRKQVFFAAGVVLVAVAVTAALTLTRSTPQREERENPGPLVAVTAVTLQDVPLVIRGTGTARPQVQVQVVPQVSGKVVAVHGSLVSGGFFRKGEPLLVIEAADYELAVQRAEADVARVDAPGSTESVREENELVVSK